MKRNIMTILALVGAMSVSAYAVTVEDAAKVDVEKACDVKANGIIPVLETAAKYNAEAKKLGVEFKRKGVTTSGYIDATMKAAKAKAKEVTLTYKKKGKEKHHKFTTEYAAWRSCHFAIRALQQVKEAEEAWRLAVPGDGYKF